MKAEQVYDRDYERDPYTMELVRDIHRRWASGRSALDLLHRLIPCGTERPLEHFIWRTWKIAG